jgi:DNA-binding transcriptional regulator YiaG/predicted RNA binding protein YcfA (HicA-like mRNA interferase family)
MTQYIYGSNLLQDIHEDVRDLSKLGMVSKKTMREFDKLCLAPVLPMSGEEIRGLREREGISQPVFARHLNVSKNLISDQKMKNQPHGITFQEADQVLTTKGYRLDRKKGSHRIYINGHGDVVTIPERNPIKKVYVAAILERI